MKSVSHKRKMAGKLGSRARARIRNMIARTVAPGEPMPPLDYSLFTFGDLVRAGVTESEAESSASSEEIGDLDEVSTASGKTVPRCLSPAQVAAAAKQRAARRYTTQLLGGIDPPLQLASSLLRLKLSDSGDKPKKSVVTRSALFERPVTPADAAQARALFAPPPPLRSKRVLSLAAYLSRAKPVTEAEGPMVFGDAFGAAEPSHADSEPIAGPSNVDSVPIAGPSHVDSVPSPALVYEPVSSDDSEDDEPRMSYHRGYAAERVPPKVYRPRTREEKSARNAKRRAAQKMKKKLAQLNAWKR